SQAGRFDFTLRRLNINKTKLTMSFLAAFLFVITCATAGQASAQRTFVAGPGIGNDSNTASDCSFSAPCRNFSAAYTVTNTGGEIIALSPGVGYGALTITHAITVTGLPGQVAFVAVAAGTTGFTVAAGASELVVVQNITFNGSGAGSNTGLSHTSGKLVVKNCVFSQLATGLSVTNTKMDLISSDFYNNGTGVSASGTGTDGQLANIPVTMVRIALGNVIGNTVGLKMLSPGTNFANIWFFGYGAQVATPNVVGNTAGEQQCTPGCTTIQNIPTFGPNTILP
ncbi:MAG: hypothetical protein QOI77_483, partial [Blastocatellia bacterium]|nr:hypothetical protein [Blastocatellia bacterium]